MSTITQKTLINNQAFSFVDCSISIGTLKPGVDFSYVGIPIKSISYNVSQQKTMNYENSKYPTTYSLGKVSVTGSVTFQKDTFEALKADISAQTAGGKGIHDMPPLTITLNFVVKAKAAQTIITNVLFTTENMSAAEGDDTIQVTCDFIAANVLGTGVTTDGSLNPINYTLHDNQR